MSIQGTVRYASMGGLRRWVLLLSFIVVLGACNVTPREYSREVITLTARHNQQIAEDVVSLLVDAYPLATTTFVVHRDRRKGRFGRALETQLRQTGYALAVNPHRGQPLIYFLDRLAVDHYRVDIRVGSTDRTGLVYRVDSGGHLILHSGTVRGGSGRQMSQHTTVEETPKNYLRDAAGSMPIVAYRDVVPGSDSAEKEASTSSAGAHESTMWAVQVISLSSHKTGVLDAIKRSVEGMGYKAYIVEVDGAKKVRVGPFASLAVARPVLYDMRANGYPDAFFWRGGRGR